MIDTSQEFIDLTKCTRDGGKYLLWKHPLTVFVKAQQFERDFLLEEFQFSISTIHCAQGAEYDNVVLYVETPISLKLCYTALTRAKKSFQCIGKGPLTIVDEDKNVIQYGDIC